MNISLVLRARFWSQVVC